MACVPDARLVVNVATPLFTGTAPEIGVVPSRKTTVPVAAAGLIVATKVRGVPGLKLVSRSFAGVAPVFRVLPSFFIAAAFLRGCMFAALIQRGAKARTTVTLE